MPVSAAGIFLSNLNDQKEALKEATPNQTKFEEDLGCSVINEFQLYEELVNASKRQMSLCYELFFKMYQLDLFLRNETK